MACCKEITQDTCQAAIPAKGNAGDSDIYEQVGPVTAPTGASCDSVAPDNFDPELWDCCIKFVNINGMGEWQ